MKVLSLFDGMSCGQLALQKIGANVTTYYASEIDKYAIQIAKKNFPNTIHLGDVRNINGTTFPQKRLCGEDLGNEIDLLIGGSPCQGFSFAGKQLNFDDPRSKLFFEFVRIKKLLSNNYKKLYFLLENVVMSKASQQVISQYLGVEPIEINSSLVSAQHRKRLYWTNIPFEMPDDKKIYLKDILENGLASDKMTKDGKAYCLTARYQGAVWWNSIQRKQRTMVKVDKPISKYGLKQVGVADLNGHDLLKRVYSKEGKSPTLNAHGGGNTEPKVAIDDVVILNENQKRKIDKINTTTDKANCVTTAIGRGGSSSEYLTSVKKKTLALEKFKINPEIVSNYVPDLKGAVCDPYNKRIIKGDKSTALRTNSSNGNTWVNDEKHSWRKLTPLECERLQTVPDNYTQGVSNTQRYKMIGNGWTVDVIAHILKNITKE